MMDLHTSADSDWRTFHDLGLHPIAEHALDAFSENGYHGTTVRDIARRVDVTVPAIYYHFKNKQDLLMTLLMMGMGTALERVRAAQDEAAGDILKRFDLSIEAIVLYEAHYRQLAFLDSEIRSLEPENRERYLRRRAELQDLLTAAVEAGVNTGVFATEYPRECSRAILAMCQGVATWYRPSGPLSPEAIAQQYVSFARGAAAYVG